MKTKLIPLTITVGEDRLAGFRFAAKHHQVKLEDLLAYRLLAEIDCLQSCNTFRSLENLEQDKSTAARDSFTINLNSETLAFIRRISKLLNRDSQALCRDLLDSVGKDISRDVGDFLNGDTTNDFFMDTREDIGAFKIGVTEGKVSMNNDSDLWEEFNINREVALAHQGI